MSKENMSLHLIRKIVLDAFLLGALIACNAAVAYLWFPFQRGFFCGDESLMYPYSQETIPARVMKSYCWTIPPLAFLFCEWTLLHKRRDGVRCFGIHVPAWLRGFYGVTISFAVGSMFIELATNITKNMIGRPRPFFFEMCKPSVDCGSPEWQRRYIQPHEYHCTGDQTDMFREMRMSFLSGHSALSSFTMIFLALYLEKRMTWRGTRVTRHVLQFAVVLLSWCTALSRISDYWHHWSDVLAGYSLGTTMAVLVLTCGTDLMKNSKDILPSLQNEVVLTSRQAQVTTTQVA